ncbi:MAG: NTP transferase domain-containing protein [Nitrospinota bacterium]
MSKAVILAAGSGSRLRKLHRSPVKPLVKVLGVTLVERQLRALTNLAGLDEVIVVVGCEADAVRDRIERSAPWPFVVRAVENPDWERGNGDSLYAAKEWVEGENFFVLMVDHLFEPGTIERFAAEAGEGPGLAVSTGRIQTLNLDDATKVRIDDCGRIRALGKDLADFTAVEMGLFQLDGRIFPALERAFQEGEYSLTSGVQRFVEKSPLCAVPLSCSWFDIDTRQELRQAEGYLLSQIPSGRDGLVAKYLNRKLSLPLSRRLANLGVKPAHITVCAFAMSLLSGALFALGFPLPAGLIAQASSVVDGMDGEVARMRGMATRFGAFIDALLDRLGEGAVLVGLSLLALSSAPGLLTFVLAALAILVSPLSMEVKDRYYVVYNRIYVPEDRDRWTRFLLANHDGRMVLVCLGGIFSVPRLTLALLVGLGLVQTAYRVWQIRRIDRTQSVGTQADSASREDLDQR